MVEGERKDVMVRNENPAPTQPNIRQARVDTRSREAFELLKLGEAICKLQVDQRKMLRSTEDMRFERDRFKSSAASFQDKLFEALNENTRLRDLREVLRTLYLQRDKQAEQSEEWNCERARLTTALDQSEERIKVLRTELVESNERLDALHGVNAQALAELKEAKVQAECMRQAFADMAQSMINEIKLANDGGKKHAVAPEMKIK
jgi:small-conductance mechanosensitive channel